MQSVHTLQQSKEGFGSRTKKISPVTSRLNASENQDLSILIRYSGMRRKEARSLSDGKHFYHLKGIGKGEDLELTEREEEAPHRLLLTPSWCTYTGV